MKPHKHAELIKAWADGAEIEVERILYGWVNAPTPQWLEQAVYRIKPTPKPDHIRYTLACLQCADTFSTRPFSTDNLKLTFDGETLQLIKAEVMHKQKAP